MGTILNRRRSVFSLGACAFLFAVCSLSLQAQTGDTTISGTVADVSGRPIGNAAVSVRNESGGVARQATTDADGRFSTSGLPEGTYTIEASAPSFSTSRRTGVKLPPGATEKVSMSLNVSELAQSITVEGSVS